MTTTPDNTDPAARREVLSVSQLTALIKHVLESTFPLVWVSGELSDVARPQSGHLYFTLKDAGAQIRGVMWRSAAAGLKFKPADGQQIICQVSLDVYPPRGTYQIVVRRMEPLGVGALQLALQQRQEKLAAEGLFAAEHKRRLPRFPRRIAVITSPTGAAVRDFLEVIRRRWTGAHVWVLPVRVQGDGAAQEVVRAIRLAHRLRQRPDVLVITRGGGSLEDLWTFNEESVVRAIFAAEIPIVSAIGHEIDVTLADLVADVRALTPSEAAERVAPSQQDLVRELGHLDSRLRAAIERRLGLARNRIDWLARRSVLLRPWELVRERARRVDELELRAERLVRQHLVQHRRALAALGARLESLSPLAVLQRGFSLTRTADGGLVKSVQAVRAGDTITSQVADGLITSRVASTEPGDVADHRPGDSSGQER